MLAIGKRPRVYLSRIPTDMRCSFEGLSNRVQMVIKQDPLSGQMTHLVHGSYVVAPIIKGLRRECLEAVRLQRGRAASWKPARKPQPSDLKDACSCECSSGVSGGSIGSFW